MNLLVFFISILSSLYITNILSTSFFKTLKNNNLLDFYPFPIGIMLISYLILISTLIILLYYYQTRNRWNQYIPIIGIFLAAVLAYYPIVDKTGVFSQIIDAIIKSWQIFVLNVDHGSIILTLSSYPQQLIVPYELLIGILNILAPVCTAVIILSLIGDILSQWKIDLFNFRDRHIFSELNEKTWALAKSMIESNVSGFYIFCDINKAEREENPYYEDANRKECIFFDNHILSLDPAEKARTHYYIISENGCENTSHALILMDKYQGRKDIEIFILSNEIESEYLLDNKLKNIVKENGEQRDAEINLNYINEPQFVAYDLLYNVPLYCAVKKDWNKVSMLIVGAGYFGLEVLKNSLWCSRTNWEEIQNPDLSTTDYDCNYSFNATIVDKNIKRAEGQFIRACPDLHPDTYNVSFHQDNIDADTHDLLTHLNEKEGCYNYIVIATNNDETNIKAALDIHAWYNRKNYHTIICVAIRDKQKFDLIQELRKDDRDSTAIIEPFACIADMYQYNKILNNPLKKMGICINAVYDHTNKKNSNDETNEGISYKSAIGLWKRLIIQKKRSNMALALFIKYFLWIRGYSLTLDPDEEKIIDEIIIPEHLIERYSKLEHERWNTYQLTEGYYRWDFDSFMRYAKDEASPKSRLDTHRLHACITDWETILKIDKETNGCYEQYDREIIRNIPLIISGYNGEFGYKYGVKKR